MSKDYHEYAKEGLVVTPSVFKRCSGIHLVSGDKLYTPSSFVELMAHKYTNDDGGVARVKDYIMLIMRDDLIPHL